MTNHQKSSLGGYDYDKIAFLPLQLDTNRVEARFEDGTTVAIDCIAIEDEYGNTSTQRAELDWLLYNKPLEYAQMVLRGEMGIILPLAVTTAGWRIEPQKTRGKTANRAVRISQRKFSVNHAKSAYFQRKSRKVSVNHHLPYK